MNIEFLKKLCRIIGPSGSEADVREAILAEIKSYVDDVSVDPLGSLIARKKGPGPKMMLAGHMDQIGFMVHFIDENGFLRFSNVGGFTLAELYSQRVVFQNGTRGVIRHEKLDDPKAAVTQDKMYIDIGAKDKAHAEQFISIGDVCVYDAPCFVDDYKIMTPALDDRVGCFIMVEALKMLKNPQFDIYFVFTAQEEVGLRGAKAAAYTVEPDYAVSFDVTLAYDTPNADKMPMKMGAGTAIKLMDNSLLCHPLIVRHLEKAAKANDIQYQFEILTRGGTDSGAIHTSKAGVPSGVISVPTRYVHAESELCALADIEESIKLAAAMLETPIVIVN